MNYPTKMTPLEEYINVYWLPRKETELKISTFTRYEGLSKRIIEQLGHIPISKLQQAEIYDFYLYLHKAKSAHTRYLATAFCVELVKRKKGIKAYIKSSILNEKCVQKESAEMVCKALKLPLESLFIERTEKLSDRTISHYHKLLYGILKDAAYDGIVKDNIMDRIRPPKIKDANEARCLDIDDAQTIIQYVKAFAISPYREAILLILYTGMRRGEACGLEWRDIDFDENIFAVRRGSYYLPKKGIYTDTLKTPRSKRIISFDYKVMKTLEDILKYQVDTVGLTEKELMNSKTRLILTEDGQPINPNNLTKYYHRFITEYDLSSSSIHTLRHTNASVMIAANTPITTVSNRLGHSNPEITLRYYAHQLSGENEKAAKKIEKLL